MPTSVEITEDNKFTVVFSTDIKDYNKEKTGYLTPIPVLRGKDIKIPLEAKLIVEVEIEHPSNKLSIKRWTVVHNSTGLEQSWGDRLTNDIVVNATTRYLWEEGLALPVPSPEFVIGLYSLIMEDDSKVPVDMELLVSDKGTAKISSKGDINKGFIIATYLFAVNNIPAGFQLEYCEKLLGMNSNEMSNFLSRYSITFQDLVKAELTGKLFTSEEKFDYKNKPVYFSKHTDKKIVGGYLPKWVQVMLEDYLSDKLSSKVTLPPEMTGATQ